MTHRSSYSCLHGRHPACRDRADSRWRITIVAALRRAVLAGCWSGPGPRHTMPGSAAGPCPGDALPAPAARHPARWRRKRTGKRRRSVAAGARGLNNASMALVPECCREQQRIQNPGVDRRREANYRWRGVTARMAPGAEHQAPDAGDPPGEGGDMPGRNRSGGRKRTCSRMPWL